MADADRLQAIQDDFSRALEGRITDLMARVQAAREIQRQIQDAGNDIAMAEGEIANTEEELEQYESDSEAHEAGMEQLEALRQAVADTEAYRGELIEALGKLVGDIGG